MHLVVIFNFFSHFAASSFYCNDLWIFMSASKGINFSSQLIAEQPLGGLVLRKPSLAESVQNPQIPGVVHLTLSGEKGSRLKVQGLRLKIKIQNHNSKFKVMHPMNTIRVHV